MLNNLYKLGSELLKQNRRLHVFYITYNKIHCNVIFHRLIKPIGYWTIQLEFIKATSNESLSCYANKATTNLNFNKFCDFFNINTNTGNSTIRDIYCSFYKSLNNQIPTIISVMDNGQRYLMSNFICSHEAVDESKKIYLYDIRKTGHRTEYNNDKAAALYPDIYDHFKYDLDHSFCFSSNANIEVTLDQLLTKLRKRSLSKS